MRGARWSGATGPVARGLTACVRSRERGRTAHVSDRAAGLRTFLKDNIVSKEVQDSLAVAEVKLGGLIKDKLGIQCVHDASIDELFRGIRGQLNGLIAGTGLALMTPGRRCRARAERVVCLSGRGRSGVAGLPESEMNAMVLGLSHSLSRYKLKFSPDKVDTMIIQAIGTGPRALGASLGRRGRGPVRTRPAEAPGRRLDVTAILARPSALLDDLDKELNTYAMRVKEWYGWHFPELSKVLVDNIAFAKTVKVIGAAPSMA